MSALPGNEYAPTAGDFTAEACQIQAWEVAERAVIAANAQTMATLALAHEQRTANLIAYVDKIDDTSAAIPVVNEIKSRLGLNEGATP